MHQLVPLRNYQLLLVVERWPARLYATIKNLVLSTTHIVLAHSTSAHLLRVQVLETLDLVNFERVGTLGAGTIRGANTLLLLLHVKIEVWILDIAHVGRLLLPAEQVTPIGLLADGASAIATDLASFGLGVPASYGYV